MSFDPRMGIRENARGIGAASAEGRRRGPLRGLRQALDGLDADDRRDAGRLELAPGVAEESLDSGGIEPAADLIRPGDGEVLAGGGKQAARFELFLKGLHLGFGAFENGVGLADRVGEGFVAEIVESIMMLGSLGHGFAPVAWVRAGREGGSSPRPAFVLPVNHGEVNSW
jgi:hypothetical protein